MLSNYVDAVILCGGIGSRAADITRNLPKALLPINGKTILEWQLKIICSLPVNRIILATHYLSYKIEEFCNKLNKNNIIIASSNKLLDTGGALKDVVDKYGPMPQRTIVLNGDIYCNICFRHMLSFFQKDYKILMMTLFSKNAQDFGSVVVNENRILSFKEKAADIDYGLVNGGFYIFSKTVLENHPENKVFSLEYDVFPYINNIFSYYHNGIWHDVGDTERYTAVKKPMFNIL